MVYPNCEKAWFVKYLIEFSKSKWKYFYSLARQATCNTKIIEFQFKIVHRIYATNSYVSNFDNSVSKICQRCNVEDNITHLFVDCQKVQKFWDDFKTYIAGCLNKHINLTTVEIIFGKLGLTNAPINFCVLHAKWFIHLDKDKHIISFHAFKRYLRNVFTIEKQIYTNNGRLHKFSKLYGTYVENL